MKILIVCPSFDILGGVANHYKGLAPFWKSDIFYVFQGKRKNIPAAISFIPDFIKYIYLLLVKSPDVVIVNPSLRRYQLFRDSIYVIIAKLFPVKVITFIHGEEAYQEALELNYLQNQAIIDYAKDKITEKQIEKYYKDEIVGDVKISHILFTSDASSDATDDEKEEAEKKALEEAEKVLKELDGLKGEELTKKFSELAKEYSDDEYTKDDGGSLGYINKGTLGTSYQAVEDEAYKLKNGEVSSEVVKTSIGYHIVLRVESKEKASLEDVKDTILEDLSDEYLSENADASIKALQELRKKYDVDIIDTELHTQYANYIQNALLAVQTGTQE